MANIIWSFGIALTAQDQASEKISDVLSVVNQLDASLNRLNETASQTTTAFQGIGRESDEATGAIQAISSKGAGSFGTLAAGAKVAGAGIIGVGLTIASTLYDVGKATLGVLWDLAKAAGPILLSATKAILPIVTTAAKTLLSGFDSMLNITLDAGSSLVNVLQTIPDTISKWVFGKGLDDLKNQLNGAYRSTQEFISLGNEFYPLQQALVQLSLHGRGAETSAKALGERIIDTAIQSGVSTRALTELSATLTRYGQNLGTVVGLGGKGSLGVDLKTLGVLSDRFGIGADGAATLSTSLKYLGQDLGSVTTRAAQLGVGFGMPVELMQMLPEVSRHAADSLARFGKNVVGDERKIVENTLRTGATFSKAFGKDIAEATGMAIQSFTKFSESLEADQDVMLGLRDDFSPLQTALFQYGASYQQTQILLKQGRDEPLKLAANFRKMAQSMDPAMAQRFIRQISKELPEQGRLLRMSSEQFTKTVEEDQEARARASTEGAQAFDKLTASLSNNASEMMKIFENIKGAFKDTFGLLFAEDMTDVFSDLVDGARTFATSLRTEFAKFAESEGFKTARSALKSIATVLIGMGEASGMAASVVGVISTAAGLLTPLASSLEIIRGTISSLGPKGELSFGGIVKGVFKTIVGIETLSETFNEVEKAMNGSEKGWSKFTAVGKTILLGFANYADKLFFGLPGKFVTQFVYGAEAKKHTFGEALIVLFSKAQERIREQLVLWRDAFLASDFIPSLGKFGEKVGSALGNVTKTVIDWVSGLFDENRRAKMLDDLQKMFTTTAVEQDSIGGSLLAIGAHVFDGLKKMAYEFGDAFLGAFGTNLDVAFEQAKLSFRGFALSAEASFDTLRSAFFTIQEYGVPVFKVLTTVLGAAMQGVLALTSGFVATQAAVTKAALYARSILPEKLGGISKAVYEQSKKEVDDMAAGFQEKIGGFSNTVSSVNDTINAIDTGDLATKQAILNDRATKRDEARLAIAREELALRHKQEFYKNPREALLKELKLNMPNTGTTVEQDFRTNDVLKNALARVQYEQRNTTGLGQQKFLKTREEAILGLLDEMRNPNAKEAGGAPTTPIAPSPSKPGPISPPKAQERVSYTPPTSLPDMAQQMQMLGEFKAWLQKQKLEGKVTVDVKGDELSKQWAAFIASGMHK